MNNVEKFNEWKLNKWWSHFETKGYKPPKELVKLVGKKGATGGGNGGTFRFLLEADAEL